MLYTIGNSHAHVFTDSPPNYKLIGSKNSFRSISLGPTIAYNFFEHHYTNVLSNISKLDIQKDDYIILVVGEVDCRWHLPKQSYIQNRNINDLVKECIDRFYRSHLDLKSSGYNVISWGGHPSTNGGHDENPNQPVFGNVFFRNEITRLWDNYLQTKSNEHCIPHVSIVDELINDDNSTKMEYYIDYCHLNYKMINNIVVKKFKEINIFV